MGRVSQQGGAEALGTVLGVRPPGWCVFVGKRGLILRVRPCMLS